MAIDSENKRRSVVSHRIPGLGIRPRPDGAISISDRRHSGLYYAGIDPQFISTTFWVPSYDANTATWTQNQFASSNWKNGSNVTSTWVNQQEARDE